MSRSDRSISEQALVIVLRIMAAFELAALGAVFLPTRWMAGIHAGLGLGPFPDAPLTEYLTRSLSALYAFHGAVLLFLSFHVRRHLAVVALWGWLTLVMGAGMLILDLVVGMPLGWTLAEGPSILVVGSLLVLLSRRLQARLGAPR
ncbi:MAG: hypothetical protein NUV77_13050 [Thermoguttaceae bacterium]|jgi:hypothetical protein|nr:hypothetical protein [Thermoguttaceae bacterium]